MRDLWTESATQPREFLTADFTINNAPIAPRYPASHTPASTRAPERHGELRLCTKPTQSSATSACSLNCRMNAPAGRFQHPSSEGGMGSVAAISRAALEKSSVPEVVKAAMGLEREIDAAGLRLGGRAVQASQEVAGEDCAAAEHGEDWLMVGAGCRGRWLWKSVVGRLAM